MQDSVYRLYAFFYAFIAESVSCYIDWRKVGSWVKLIFCFLQQSFSSHVTWSVFSENNFWILLLLALQHLHVFLLLYCITSSVACGFVLLGNICSLNAKCRTCLNRHTTRHCVTCHLNLFPARPIWEKWAVELGQCLVVSSTIIFLIVCPSELKLPLPSGV